MRSRVAFFARHRSMLAFEQVPGQLMVEFFLGFFPMNQGKVGAIMLEVTTDTISAVGVLHSQLGMVAMILCEEPGDLFVAVQALEGRCLGAELVATSALGSA